MERSSKWFFLVYPESAPSNWLEILEAWRVRCAISPLHQPDGVGKTDEAKKEHYHVILDFEKRQKSQTQVKKICESVNGTLPFIPESPIGYYEYLIHKNSKDKEQFEEGFKAITHMNGFDVNAYQQLDDDDKGFIVDILTIINDEGFTEMAQLVNYCMANDVELLKPLRRNAYFFNSYLSSSRALMKAGFNGK